MPTPRLTMHYIEIALVRMDREKFMGIRNDGKLQQGCTKLPSEEPE